MNIFITHTSNYNDNITNDYTLFHKAIFSLLSEKQINTATFIATGLNTSQSNLAAKVQTLIYSETYHQRNSLNMPLVSEIEYILQLPPGWKPRVYFTMIDNIQSSKANAISFPEHLRYSALAAATIPNITNDQLIKNINQGIIFIAQTSDYLLFIKQTRQLGANFSNSILIINNPPPLDHHLHLKILFKKVIVKSILETLILLMLPDRENLLK